MNTSTELDTFTRSYIETALWSSTGSRYGQCPCCGEMAVLDRLPEPEFEQQPMCAAEGCGVREMNSEPPLDQNYSIDDIAPETLAQMVADCERFQSEHSGLLEASELSAKRQGHDFWLNRNGHGSGFWDEYFNGGPEEAACDELSAHCESYGSFDLYVGDDGKIHGQ